MRARLAKLAFDQGGALGVATLILYVVLAPSHIVDGEAAEFSTLAVTGGVAHPSGYPLYVLFLRATAWLPGASAAHSAAIATAILAAGSIVMLHAACRAWGARPGAAGVACAIIAAAPVVLRMYTQAEVFALNGLAVAAILWLAGPVAPPVRGARRVVLLALVAGLALTNHLSAGLLAPVGLYGAVVGLRETPRARRAIVVGGAIVAFVVGLVPYLYLLAAPSDGLSWGRIDGFGPLLDHVLRKEYGGAGAFAPTGEEVSALRSIGALGMTLGRSWLWLPLAVGVGALVLRVARGPARVAWACLASSIVIAGPVLAARFNLPPEPGLLLYVCQRFHLLPAVLLAVPVAAGIDAIADRVPRPLGVPAQVAAMLVVLAGAIALSLPGLRRAHSPALERGLRFALAAAPDRAVVLTSGDVFDTGGGYLQHAEGVRRDVTLLNVDMMPLSWYRERAGRALGVPAFVKVPNPETVLAAAAFAAGRPLAADFRVAPRFRGYTVIPRGILFELLPQGAPTPPLSATVDENHRLFAALDLDYPPPTTHDDWPADIHRQYEYVWRVLSRTLEKANDPQRAADAAALADALAPRPP